MIKLILLAAVVAFSSIASARDILSNTAEGVIFEKKVPFYNRVSSGTPAERGKNLDYAFLSVVFINQAQICGGTLVQPEWILTSATCLSDPAEGLASFVYVALGGSNNPKLTHREIVLHPEYDYKTHANDIALLRLSEPVKVDNRKIALANIEIPTRADDYIGARLLYCGFGSTENKPTKPRGLTCTSLNAVTAAAGGCTENSNIICTYWNNKDNNVCPGDYGGPLYVQDSDPPLVIGIATFSPGQRANSPCKDGHSTEFAQIKSYFDDFILATIFPAGDFREATNSARPLINEKPEEVEFTTILNV